MLGWRGSEPSYRGIDTGLKEDLHVRGRCSGNLGEWANIMFLVDAIAVRGSTLWAAIPSWSRMYTKLLRVLDWNDAPARLRWIRIFTVAQPIIWGATYLFIRSPVRTVQIGGVMTGIIAIE